MCNFYIKTTVTTQGIAKIDGVATALDANDVFTLVLKNHIDDTDAEAVVTVVGTLISGTTGGVLFSFTPTITDIDPGLYYMEIKWVRLTAVYIVETSTVSALKRVWD
jgi:hypothetical protein